MSFNLVIEVLLFSTLRLKAMSESHLQFQSRNRGSSLFNTTGVNVFMSSPPIVSIS